MAIKNVIFDFGQVLAHFEPAYMVGRYVTDEADAKLLEEVVFDRLYWDRLDAGTITGEETLAACRTRLPERLWEVADTIFYNWIYNLPPVEGMEELILHLKEDCGLPLYLLSNISHYFADHREEIPILRHMDGCVFSARLGIVKPDPAIFAHLCKTYGLNPAESIFIDDNAANVAAAAAFGLQIYHFDGDAKKLRAYLDANL